MATAETQQTEVRAQARYVRTAPRKAMLVAEQIRGRTVPEARTILAFTMRDAARDVRQVLDSAVANAEANHGLDGDELIVAAAYVGSGPTLKRWRPRARGRASRIHKRTCHITIELALPGRGVLPAVRPAPAPQPAALPPEEEETPKPKRAARPKTPEAETEEKPKPKRAAKPKAEAAEEKPKRPRAAKPKTDAAEEKPKRAPRRKKTDEGSTT
jgi:large subunit ribosomal protein L22